jgi:3-methyladenine DNA glycosylase Mpg
LLSTLLTDKVAQEELPVAVLLNALLPRVEAGMMRKFRFIHVVRLTKAPGLTYALSSLHLLSMSPHHLTIDSGSGESRQRYFLTVLATSLYLAL